MRDWIIFNTILYEKTLKESMIDEKTDENGSLDLKKIYNHYLDKRKEIMKNSHLKVEDRFGDVTNEDSILPKKSTKLNNFVSQIILNTKVCININLIEP